MIATKYDGGRRFHQGSVSRKRRAGAGKLLLMSLLLIAFPIATPVLAVDNTYTISLASSASAAAPGETWEIHVKIHNDGWPATGTVDVAAFQGTLDYDRSLAEYQNISFPDGMMGDFNPDTGTMLAYGEKQEFDESTEIAVLTFRSPEQAVGTESFALRDLLLAKRDYTQLNPQAGEGATLTIGNADAGGSESAIGDASGSTGSPGNGNPAIGNAGQGNGTRAADRSSSGESESESGTSISSGQRNGTDAGGNAASGSSDSPDGTAVSEGSENTASGDGTGKTNGSDPSDPQNAEADISGDSSADTGLRPDEESGKNGINPGDDSTGTGDGGTGSQNAGVTEQQGGGTHIRKPVGILVLLAAVAAAGMLFYRKRKH